jgi:hypothetical protein
MLILDFPQHSKWEEKKMYHSVLGNKRGGNYQTSFAEGRHRRILQKVVWERGKRRFKVG